MKPNTKFLDQQSSELRLIPCKECGHEHGPCRSYGCKDYQNWIVFNKRVEKLANPTIRLINQIIHPAIKLNIKKIC